MSQRLTVTFLCRVANAARYDHGTPQQQIGQQRQANRDNQRFLRIKPPKLYGLVYEVHNDRGEKTFATSCQLSRSSSMRFVESVRMAQP
jgi:hypothetical protein